MGKQNYKMEKLHLQQIERLESEKAQLIEMMKHASEVNKYLEDGKTPPIKARMNLSSSLEDIKQSLLNAS
jgi:hypothetical protein